MLKKQWELLRKLPGGRKVFCWSLRWIVPYTGRLGAEILEIAPGKCRVLLHDRRRVRNHLNSVHAMALANLAEMTSGMALVYDLPKDQRSILIDFHIEYLKKARGTLEARSDFAMPKFGADQEFVVGVEVFDAKDEIVCRARARWKIGPMSGQGGSGPKATHV